MTKSPVVRSFDALPSQIGFLADEQLQSAMQIARRAQN
jgi:hypothetical protein